MDCNHCYNGSIPTRSNESYFSTCRMVIQTRSSFTYSQFLELSRRISAAAFLDNIFTSERPDTIDSPQLPTPSDFQELFKKSLKDACLRSPAPIQKLLADHNFINTTGLNYSFFRTTSLTFGLNIPTFLKESIIWQSGNGSGNNPTPLFQYGVPIKNVAAMDDPPEQESDTVLAIVESEIILPQTADLVTLQNQTDLLINLKSKLASALPKSIFVGRVGQGRYGRVKLHQKFFVATAEDNSSGLVIGRHYDKKKILHIRSKMLTRSFRAVLSSSFPPQKGLITLVLELNGSISICDPFSTSFSEKISK